MTADPLLVSSRNVGRGSPIRTRVVADAAAMSRVFADDMVEAFALAKSAGRDKVVFIVPVGPVGQFELFAERVNAERLSLRDLVVVNMDEYLTADGRDFIAPTDPLSFVGHMQRALWSRLDPALAPPPEQRHFPHPRDPAATTRLIDSLGGVDVTWGGVGITGHLAFNEPPEPDEADDVEAFAQASTRVLRLSRETLTINAVTATRGNIDCIPRLAITVGMREILASRRIRIFMNRPWQCAIARKLLHGPVTARCPASLLQRHGDVLVTMTEEVVAMPEATLR